MKTIKDPHLSVLYQVFGWQGRHHLSAAVLAGFALGEPAALLDEADMWDRATAALGHKQVLDLSMPKSRGEVMVLGNCYAPPGREVKGATAFLRLGRLEKRVEVLGDRYLKRGLLKFSYIEPKPYTEMPLTWDRAFGGPDYPANPVGKGMVPIIGPTGHKLIPLPNIEYTDQLVTSPGDRPKPAGLGPLGLDWPIRLKNLGTFDRHWVSERWPALPDDFDFQYFNQAPEDQRIDGYFQGDEFVLLRGMHPKEHELMTHLPGVRCRLFINRPAADSGPFQEIHTRLDTVYFLPHLEAGVLIWHGTAVVDDDEAEDVGHLMTFYEPMADKPLPVEYYLRKLEPPAEDLAEAEPEPESEMPETVEPAVEEPADTPPEKQPPVEAAAALAVIEKGISQQEAELKQYLAEHGIDPKELESPLESAPKITEELTPQEHLSKLKESISDSENALLKLLQDLDLKPDEISADFPSTPVAPELTNASDLVAYLKVIGVDDPEILDQLGGLYDEHEVILAKLSALQAGKPAPTVKEPPPDKTVEPDITVPAALTREDVLAGYATGKSFARADLSGLDLSGCELPGIDLAGADLAGTNFVLSDLTKARLAGANLTQADLSGARMDSACLAEAEASWVNLSDADLTRADLRVANLTGALLEKANLNQCDLSRARLDEAILTEADLSAARLVFSFLSGISAPGADFTEAELTRADLRGSDLTGVNLAQARLFQADLSGAQLPGATLLQADCSSLMAAKANFTNANLSGALFVEADLAQADMSGALLDGADFSRIKGRDLSLSGARGEEVNFEAAQLPRCRADGQTSFKKGRFVRADLSGASWEDVHLTEADFSQALLPKAHLNRCQFKMANLSGVDARGANLAKSDFSHARMRAIDLLNGSLRKACLKNADLTGANLHAVDLYKSIHEKTILVGANIDRTLLTLSGGES